METSDVESEGQWIRLAQAGEPGAFPRLVGRHGASLLRGALAFCRDRQLAEDIVQETLVEAWRSLARFDGRCRFSTWLYGILRHRYLKAAQRHWRANLVELSAEVPDAVADDATDPSLVSQRSEDARRLRQSVAALPDGQRLVIELRFFADASLELAAKLRNRADVERYFSTVFLPKIQNVLSREEQYLIRIQLLSQAVQVQRTGPNAVQPILGRKVVHERKSAGFELRCPTSAGNESLVVGK